MVNIQKHIPNPRIEERAKSGPHLTKHEYIGFNGRLAVIITSAVGTMWCAYLFAVIAFISLPMAIKGGNGFPYIVDSSNFFTIGAFVGYYGRSEGCRTSF